MRNLLTMQSLVWPCTEVNQVLILFSNWTLQDFAWECVAIQREIFKGTNIRHLATVCAFKNLPLYRRTLPTPQNFHLRLWKILLLSVQQGRTTVLTMFRAYYAETSSCSVEMAVSITEGLILTLLPSSHLANINVDLKDVVTKPPGFWGSVL